MPAGALLAALYFLLTIKLSDPLFGDVVGGLQALARATRCPALRTPRHATPRHAFLTALAKAAFPPRLVPALDEPPQVLRSAVSSSGSRWASQAAVGAAEVEAAPN